MTRWRRTPVAKALMEGSRQTYLSRLRTERARAALTLLRCTDSTQPPDALGLADAHEVLTDCLAQLSARERMVISARYGLDRKASATLSEIGCRFKITRERIRQIEARALRRLALLAHQRGAD